MNSPQAEQSTDGFRIVGIGASAGGLEAFLELLRAMPARTGMAFALVQHLEPHHESQLVEILSHATQMPVVRAEDAQRVEPDRIYVMPPNTVMEIRKGLLHLEPRKDTAGQHYPIDRFLESLAADQGTHAIGVVLSGTASDGAQGIRAIKSRCGITFCQDEKSAKFAGMPHSAIATGAVDFVLPPARIAEEIAKIGTHPFLIMPADRLEEPLAEAEGDHELQSILDRLRAAAKVDFTQYKQSTIRRRLGRRLVVHHLDTLREYLDFLDAHPAEIHDLYRDILISVTSFFREPAMFEALKRAVLPYLEGHSVDEAFRIWVPGCATGEEAYSLAMLAFEIMHDRGKDFAVQVFGTDISDSAIDHARTGIYPEKVAQDIPADRLQRFFARTDSGLRIKQQIRESCVFARHDLTSDPPFSHMDVVSCRNVFIYLNSALQQRVLPALHYCLKPGGLLVLGSAETVGNRLDLFGVVDLENKIYSKKQVSGHFALDAKPSEAGSRPLAQAFALPTPTLLDLETRAARILRDLYAPAGVLINDDMQVLQLHGQTGFYLDWAPGEASMNLLRLARESLIHPLRRTVESAFAQKQPVHESGIQVEHQGAVRQVTLTAIPLSHDARFCLVLFEDQQDRRVPMEAGQSPIPPDLVSSDASRELAQTKDYLRKVIEQNEATNEELRAANEEARSTNEELQSTNEELRTAKEQLQSSNEELTTINDELNHRNDALNVATNDLSNILNAATIPILMVGMDLRLRRFTPSAERLLAIVSIDIGRNITEVPLPFRIPDLLDMLIETVRTLGVQQRRVQDRDGRWFNLLVRPYRTVDDRIDGVVLTFIDIDEATRALEQAERAREFADGIVETVQHPLLILDSDLRVTRATGMFYKMFGVRPEDTLGQTIDDLGSGQWKIPELRRLLEQALLRDTPFRDFEITHEFPHIGTRTMRLNARRTPETDGRFSVLLAIDDVTERQEAAEIRYRRLFESAKDGVIVLGSPGGMVLDVNPAFLEMSRYPRTDLMDKPFQEIAPFLGSEEMRRLVPDTVERGMTRYDSVPVRARDGREIVVEIVANGYRVKDQALIQLNIRDVTERRRNEEELRRSNLDLQQFAFAASHDLQEPLRTVTSFLELFQRQYEGKIDAQADEYIKFITGAADRMRHLVLDLLGFSQVVRADMNRSEFSAEAALSHVLMNLQMAVESSRARITFDPLPVVYADEMQLERLLQNLIGNSLKYRGTEPPHIHVSAREAGPEWVFSVKDNGIGIDPKYSDHIFTVFKRLHGPEYPGTGIGLAVCKRIVTRHGGRIWFESEPGKGAAFFFTLPKPAKRS